MIASYGAQLLEWLEKYTFVEEQKYGDLDHSARQADFFLDELARCGTTTACCYGSAHPASVEALFAAAEARGAGMIAGTAIMDRNGPQPLLDAAKDSIAASRDLIRRWHGTGRQRYAVTPRFAITSTDAQLAAAGALLREFPTVYMQTHLAENRDEIAAVRRLFPDDPSYTAVYARAGLLGPRSLLGHCIHLDDSEVALLRDTRIGRGVLSDLEPVHRQRLVRLRASRCRRDSDRARHRCRRRYVLFDAANRGRGLQGDAAARAEFVRLSPPST